MPSPIDQVQYLYRKNLRHEHKLVEGYLREQIAFFGVPVTYFRYATDFFGGPPSGNMDVNYTYGEAPVATYPLSANMNVLLSVTEDNSLLKRFGLETSVNAEMTFLQRDFTETWRDIVGTPTTAFFSTDVYTPISNFAGNLSAEIVTGELSGMTSAMVSVPSGSTSAFFSFPFHRYPSPWNDDLAKTHYYTEQVVGGTLDGVVRARVDAAGNGWASGHVEGVLRYFSALSEPTAPGVWRIAPRVGDFIRLREFDEDVGNFEEYEVTQVDDKNLASQGLNPLLKRYVWKCTIVRRTPSHEVVDYSPTQQETFTPNYLPDNKWHTDVSNQQVFDYVNPVDSIDDKPNEDDVYGGYGQ